MCASALTLVSGKFPLETTIAIAIFEGHEIAGSDVRRAHEVFVSAVVLGELFFGAAKSGRPTENIARVVRFTSGRKGKAHTCEQYLNRRRDKETRDDSRYPQCHLRRPRGGNSGLDHRRTALALPS